MHIKAETWYWIRWTPGTMTADVLPALPYLDEHGEVAHWDAYFGKLAPSKVEVLEELGKGPRPLPVLDDPGEPVTTVDDLVRKYGTRLIGTAVHTLLGRLSDTDYERCSKLVGLLGAMSADLQSALEDHVRRGR